MPFSFPLAELLLDLDVQTEEYLDDHKTPSILIYVHDPWFYPDFGSEEAKARAGHFYSVGMRKVRKRLVRGAYICVSMLRTQNLSPLSLELSIRPKNVHTRIVCV